jgi:hypothetical protein
VYNIEEENQILEINHGFLKEYKIKALNNDFVFGIKNKIDKNLFVYPDIGKEYNISIFNSEIFIVYELDIINYDFISFDMSNTGYLENKKFYFKNNFGLLDENEIDKKIQKIFMDLKNKIMEWDFLDIILSNIKSQSFQQHVLRLSVLLL